VGITLRKKRGGGLEPPPLPFTPIANRGNRIADSYPLYPTRPITSKLLMNGGAIRMSLIIAP